MARNSENEGMNVVTTEVVVLFAILERIFIFIFIFLQLIQRLALRFIFL
jgi:hypothetical protein